MIWEGTPHKSTLDPLGLEALKAGAPNPKALELQSLRPSKPFSPTSLNPKP